MCIRDRPSIVYGILGLTACVYMFGAFNSIRVNDQPDYEVGATYFYQVKTLGGNYVKFKAESKIQPTYEIKNPRSVNIRRPIGVADGDLSR